MAQKPDSPASQPFAVKAHLFLLKITRNWLNVALGFLTLYVALSITAPILMKAGVERPARVLYTLYKPFCHQFVFRSFFLFGEQFVYPRENTGTGLVPFETYAHDIPAFDEIDFDDFGIDLIMTARDYPGNDQMGYKIALCERDLSIYLALLAVGIAYRFPKVRRRLRPVPFWLYIFLGLGPVGLDGFSQLLGYPPFELWPARESLPVFRVVTGALFGAMSGWLAFPYFAASMAETRYNIEMKLWRARIPF